MEYKNSLGIDVSVWDSTPPLDWSIAYLHGIRFATVRKSQGFYPDPNWEQNKTGATGAGILDAPYHWYDSSLHNWEKQANVFLNGLSGNLPPVLDLEDYKSKKAYSGIWKSELKPWLTLVEATTGIRPVIYTSPGYVRSYLMSAAEQEASEYPLIIAHYQTQYPFIYPPWSPGGWLAWQYWDGIPAQWYGFNKLAATGCALYVWNGTAADWKGYYEVATINPPVQVMYKALTSLSIRKEPTVTAERVGYLMSNEIFEGYETRSTDTGFWVRHDRGWSAIVYNGHVYIVEQ